MQKAAGKQVQHSAGEGRRKTRECILKTAYELFNEQGEANVTLAQIGECPGSYENWGKGEKRKKGYKKGAQRQAAESEQAVLTNDWNEEVTSALDKPHDKNDAG